jgi:ornithine carbamoyltransferase
MFLLRHSVKRAAQPSLLGGTSLARARAFASGSLVLPDKSVLRGRAFGATTPRALSGELVFYTGMTGYLESLTDPSYASQILVLTYPSIGNYGVPNVPDLLEHNAPFESCRPHVAGLVVQEYSPDYSHYAATSSLSAWLSRWGIPALTGIDTRALTSTIRDHDGSVSPMIGQMTVGAEPGALPVEALVDTTDSPLVSRVSGLWDAKHYSPPAGVPTTARVLALDCGMKANMLRCLLARGAQVTVVPYDAPLAELVADGSYDGVFLSNGPGDPRSVPGITANLVSLMNTHPDLPIFGICLGYQLMALAAGASTTTMKYGHRGQNQPVVSVATGHTYVTAQNHGYQVEASTLPEAWKPLFLNGNDGSLEGIVHATQPWYGVQFHPEARGGPADSSVLFNHFFDAMADAGRSTAAAGACLFPGAVAPEAERFSWKDGVVCGPTDALEPASLPKSVLILGSGGLSIGQAGEFDYSGSQACKTLSSLGIRVILINPNIATVQTAEETADATYLLPVTPEFVEQVIQQESPDAIMLQFGGQTALNCGLELYQSGVLDKYNVEILGTPPSAIVKAEDRFEFAEAMRSIGEPIIESRACNTQEESLQAAEELSYPVIVRAAYALGGLGSGFANNREEMITLTNKSFAHSSQVLVEKSLKGWKELEYEVVRDSQDNCVTICNMENVDPFGVHTGDSIVVAPSQTLNDREYQMLRDASIRIVRHLGVIGECNVQYALDPASMQYYVIEVNPRLSRSSALASKASGYPLAAIAAKLALGYALPALLNAVNKCTTACFEPALDYLVVKVPKFDLGKFPGSNETLSSAMKSVGEVMAIGRSFEETLQKALRMVDPSCEGFHARPNLASLESLGTPTPTRIFAVAHALAAGASVRQVAAETRIDSWFLHKMANIVNMERTLAAHTAAGVTSSLLRRAKQFGFSDAKIGALLGIEDARTLRKEAGIVPYVKRIDTLAGEVAAATNYLYLSYNATASDDIPRPRDRDTGIVLGSGTYRIGSSVEFDYASVSASRALRAAGHSSVVINNNPETVSTDFDESDRLYFDELSLERVLDIVELEDPALGVFVSFGGQIPNNLALPLHEAGVRVAGTSPLRIDAAEDRNKFSSILDEADIPQPAWLEASSVEECAAFAERVGYPLLIRPSYVLSGSAMKVVYDESELAEFLAAAVDVSGDAPVVVTKFYTGCREVEIDGVAVRGQMIQHSLAEHVEAAGTHSGDATHVLPPQTLSPATETRVTDVGAAIAAALGITGPFNMQLLVTPEDEVLVIECNVRASRSVPFSSKVMGVNLVESATRSILWDLTASADAVPPVASLLSMRPDEVAPPAGVSHFPRPTSHVGVKVAQFSFTRLPGADPRLGVEMSSTGEVATIGHTLDDALVKGLLASTMRLPRVSTLPIAGEIPALLLHAPDCSLALFTSMAASPVPVRYTRATADALVKRFGMTKGLELIAPNATSDADEVAAVEEALRAQQVVFHVNLETNPTTVGRAARRAAVDFGVGLVTEECLAHAVTRAVSLDGPLSTDSWQSIVRQEKMQYMLGSAEPVLRTPQASAAAGGHVGRNNSRGFSHSAPKPSQVRTVSSYRTRPRHRDFTGIADLSRADLAEILALAQSLRRMPSPAQAQVLAHRTLAMVFEKPSLRTRVSFETAMTQLGGHAIYLGPGEIGLGTREPVEDVGSVLSGMVDIVMARVFANESINEMVASSTIPVINGLCNLEHPCQAVTDVLTLVDHFGSVVGLAGANFVFVGDCNNNIAHSLALIAPLVGMNFTAASPPGFELDAGIAKAAAASAASAGTRFVQSHDPHAAVADASVIYTDTWVSMGDEAAAAERLTHFTPDFCVDAAMVAAAPADVVVMHDLPAYRGKEISADVLTGPRSLVYAQAHNRLHAQKGILVWLMDVLKAE